MAITGYSSPVDIGLGQTPQNTDPELFDELVDVYNAIHMINGYLDQLRIFAQGGSGSEVVPSQSMPFNRFFTATALAKIKVGDVVSPSNIAGENGILLGGLAHDYTSTAPESNFSQIALTDAEINEPVQVGVGPAVLAIPGALNGQIAYCLPARTTTGAKTNNGTIYMYNPGNVGGANAMPIGVCIRDGYVMFGQFIKR